MTPLYLVQHGAAKTEAEDPTRPLTKEGRQAVESVAEFFSRLQLSLDRIEHSGKLRAKETAEILAARLRPEEGTIEIPVIGPNDDIEPMRNRLQDETRNIMLVGHLPYLSRLAARLLGVSTDRTVVRFQMGGVLRMERDDAGDWALGWMVVPELIGQGSAAKPTLGIGQ